MQLEPSCEICGKNEWQVIGNRTYLKSDGESQPTYIKNRFKVLFERWFPEQDTITLTSNFCRHCGFIIYCPRPDEQDIHTKYDHLKTLEEDRKRSAYGSHINIERSLNMFRYLTKYVDFKKTNKILDYGGADGSLMYAFLNINQQCYVVDYNENPIPNVTRLGATITEISPNEKFDLIVCSHVLEHIAQPLKTLKLLERHLDRDGKIFIEVPMEVWRKAPLPSEPVTHINFFTPNSLYNLLVLGGLIVQKCELVACSYEEYEFHGIRAVCRKSNNALDQNIELRNPDGLAMLNPTISDIIRHHMYFPQKIPKILLNAAFPSKK